jgi:hypothetical protein
MITSHGYVAVRVSPDHPRAFGAGEQKYAYEHDLIVEERLGRNLQPGELVHHKDRNGQNNAPANLELKSRSSHAVDHNAERPRDEITGRWKGTP